MNSLKLAIGSKQTSYKYMLGKQSIRFFINLGDQMICH